MSDETTTGLAELWNSLGLDIVVGLIEIGNDAVVADCRPGSSLPETDFADQNTWQFQNVFGVACGPLKRATLCAIFKAVAASARRTAGVMLFALI